MAITNDEIRQHQDEEGNVTSQSFITSGLWQIAYLRLRGYDFDKFHIIEKKRGKEVVVTYENITEDFKKIVTDWHAEKEEAGNINLYRQMFMTVKNELENLSITTE